MRRWLAVIGLGLLWAAAVQAQGLLIPADKDLGPLTLVQHDVRINIEDQVTVTHVTQTFRNPTSRQLEATYVFPVPKDASVKKFTMWADGKEVVGELVEADKARTVYTDIVRRAQDPGLLEYVGSNLLRLRVFPIPANSDQKLSVSFTSIAAQEDDLVEYVYPLKGGKSATPLEKFTLEARLKAQHPIQNIYSPSHTIQVDRHGDRAATVRYECGRTVLDKDFQLYYTHGSKDVELTMLPYRQGKENDGTFLLLISPRAELAKKQHVDRDMVFVLDTSGSMEGTKMDQAKKALKFCLGSLHKGDRFAVINFATTVNQYATMLERADRDQVVHAKEWVDGLKSAGGTAIDLALDAALKLRSDDATRPFTVIFFTDGLPTVGETDPAKILQKVLDRNTAGTRFFTFGVGDDVNAALLDQLADKTRAVSTYVRPTEDLEVKTSALYSKISHPVLTDLKLKVGKDITLSEIYPPHLPDLFHGTQLVVLSRYHGHGPTALTLTGSVGKDAREFVYDVSFPAKTGSDKSFVVDLWARRKVGYLLEQIRSNGEKKELVDEVVALAKKYQIATPYTSYLIVPDGVPTPPVAQAPPLPVAAPQSGWGSTRINYAPVFVAPSIQWSVPNSSVTSPAPGTQPANIDWVQYYKNHGYQTGLGKAPAAGICCGMTVATPMPPAAVACCTTGKTGVDLAVELNALRAQSQAGPQRTRQAAGRTCVEHGGAWADEAFDTAMKQVTVKALSAAYFRILERQPQMKEVFQLGSRLVWVTPSGCALVIDPDKGDEEMTDDAIDALFVVTP